MDIEEKLNYTKYILPPPSPRPDPTSPIPLSPSLFRLLNLKAVQYSHYTNICIFFSINDRHRKNFPPPPKHGRKVKREEKKHLCYCITTFKKNEKIKCGGKKKIFHKMGGEKRQAGKIKKPIILQIYR